MNLCTKALKAMENKYYCGLKYSQVFIVLYLF